MIYLHVSLALFFFFTSRRPHTISKRDWSSDVCSSDLPRRGPRPGGLRCPGPRDQGDRRAHRGGRQLGRLAHAPPGERRPRSEERRVVKECRSRWAAERKKKKRRRREMHR